VAHLRDAGGDRSVDAGGSGVERLGRFFYRYRSYTPIPLIVILLLRSRPSLASIGAGLPIVFLGETLRLAALRHIGGASRGRSIGAPGLVTGGPYGRTRNPLYLGNLLLSGGLAVASGVPWLPPLLALLFAIQYIPIIAAEEAELTRRFPREFPTYERDVSVFLPSFRRRRPDRPALRSWGDAIRIERRSLVSVLLVLLVIVYHWARGGAS